jgi:hypothetical protein
MEAISGTISIEIDELHGKWAAALSMLLKNVRAHQPPKHTKLLWRGELVDVSPIMRNMAILDRPEYQLGFDISTLARIPRDWTADGCLELPGSRFTVNSWLDEEPLKGHTQTIELRTTNEHKLFDPHNLRRPLMATVVLFQSADDLIYMKLKYA